MFTRADLQASGFRGFVPLISLETSRVTTAGGVYVALRESNEAPLFLERSGGGHFKSKDPTAAQSLLEARWVENCPVVYIGLGIPHWGMPKRSCARPGLPWSGACVLRSLS